MGEQRAVGTAQDHVVDVDEPMYVGRDASLLPHLAHGRGSRRLARLDMPAG